MAMKKKKETSKFTEDWLPIANIANGMIELEKHGLEGKLVVTGVKIQPKNIFISDVETQTRTIYGLRNFYNTIDYEFWLICCDRPVDINLYKSQLELLYQNTTNQAIRKIVIQDIEKCEKFIGPEINAVDTEFYILFKENIKNIDKIQKRIQTMISGLAGAGLVSRQLTDDDARVILDSFLNDGLRVEFGTVMSDV